MKKTKNNTLIWVSIAIIVLILGLFMFLGRPTPPNVTKIDTITITDTLWKDTTIVEKVFVPKEVVKKKVDTLYLENGDTLNLITEQKRYEKSLISEKDTADLEIYVTGINTALDSLKMRLKTHTVTNTIEITKYVEKKKTFWDKINIGVGVGYGIGLKNKDIEPFIGVTITYGL